MSICVDSWEWDFDNDGTVDSTERNPVYTFETQGIYSVSLSVSGPGGSAEELKEEYIEVTEPNSIIYLNGDTGLNTNDGRTPDTAVQTFQRAIALAQDGDLILVYDSIYRGDGNKDLNHNRKDIYLKSVNGPENCIIDCSRDQSAFHLTFGGIITIDGLTIKNGDSYSDGGAIYAYALDSVTINNCIIIDNKGYWSGGMHFWSCDEVQIINCLIANNEASIAGGGIVFDSTYAVLINCTIVNNDSTEEGGGIYCWDDANAVMSNSIIWGNYSGWRDGHQIEVSGSSSLVVYNSAFSNNANDVYAANNNAEFINCIHDDPLFVDENNDFHLQASSPCINAGDNSLVPDILGVDLDNNRRFYGSAVDMGAYEYQP
ncbi:MAG: choice-of-anchor Q domain-containing protein, partial [Planctomycetota bacterium]